MSILIYQKIDDLRIHLTELLIAWWWSSEVLNQSDNFIFKLFQFSYAKTLTQYYKLPNNLGQQQMRDCLIKMGIDDIPIAIASKRLMSSILTLDKYNHVILKDLVNNIR